ncbi:hypothetical protein AAC387_Pa07g3715 [Persea americana]
MSASVCGKRPGFEEIFEATGTPSKRSRFYRLDSPIRPSDSVLGSEDQVSILLGMFPNMDRELVESVLNANDHRLEDAVHNLHALYLGDVSGTNNALSADAVVEMSKSAVQGSDNAQTSEQMVEGFQNNYSNFESNIFQNGTSWVDIFVQEMKNSSDLNDARIRTSRILEAFERSVVAHSRELDKEEMLLLKDQLQSLLRDNQILKRAVAIQHERYLEQEEKTKEVLQLKHVIGQYQEQVRTLEIEKYALKLRLQREQDCSSSIPGHFHPDVF